MRVSGQAAAELVASRRVEDAVTRCGAGIRPALTRVHHVHREKSKVRRRAAVERGYYDELCIHELMKFARIFFSRRIVELNF